MFSKEEEEFLTSPDIEPVKLFLVNTLKSKSSKFQTSPNYDLLIKNLRTRDEPGTIWRLYIALSSCVSLFIQKTDVYRDLVQAIMSYDWKGEHRINIAYTSLIGNIVSSNALFVISSIEMIVKNIYETVSNTSGFSDEIVAIRCSSLHRCLSSVLSIAPTGLSELYSVIADNFPFKKHSSSLLCGYVREILRVVPYAPQLRARIVDLIVVRCLEIDVEIVIEETGEVSIHEEEKGQTKEEVESEMLLSSSPLPSTAFALSKPLALGPSRKLGVILVGRKLGLTSHSAPNSPTPISPNPSSQSPRQTDYSNTQQIAPEVQESADKLDGLLVILTQFLEQQLSVLTLQGSETQSHKERSLNSFCEELLSIFEERMLPTHKSKFVQFVFFRMASLCPVLSQGLSRRLLQIFLEDQTAQGHAHPHPNPHPQGTQSTASSSIASPLSGIGLSLHLSSSGEGLRIQSSLRRQSALLYLTSFLARSRFFPSDFVSEIVLKLLHWCSEYTSHNSLSLSPSKLDLSAFTFSESSAGTGLRYDLYGRLEAATESPEARRSRHETFFYCVQGLCYLLCFYGCELSSTDCVSPVESSQLDSAGAPGGRIWRDILCSPLQPLHYVLPSVRTEFAGLACHLGLCSPRDLAQYLPLSESEGSNAGFNSFLDVFFPFDPCLLDRLSQLVEGEGEGAYRFWSGLPPGMTEDTEILHSEDEGEEEEVDDEEDHEEEEEENSDRCSRSSQSQEEDGEDGAMNLSSSPPPAWTGTSSYLSLHDLALRRGADPGGGGGGGDSPVPLRRARNYSITSTGSW